MVLGVTSTHSTAGIFGESSPHHGNAGQNGGGRVDHDGGGGGGGLHCFLPGTLIETPDGAAAIEQLQPGSLVLTVSGEAKPVKWIGRRTVSRDPETSWGEFDAPVKISQFAIDGKAPTRDLYVSPAHAVFIDGLLIPAMHLVNGLTIEANAKPEALTLTYYHIELETHEAIFAEGLAVETFLGDTREAFDNVGEYIRLYGSIGEPLTPFAPTAITLGGRQRLASHIRSTIAPLYDCRKPVDRVRDRLINQALFAHAA